MEDVYKWQIQEAQRLEKWASQNTAEWARLCSPEPTGWSAGDMLHQINLLEANGFYYLLPMLLRLKANSYALGVAMETVGKQYPGTSLPPLIELCASLKEILAKQL